MSGSYDATGFLPGSDLGAIPEGTNVAIAGPAMTGKQELALELLATGYQDGEGILCITTNSSSRVYSDLERHVDSLDRTRVGIIDASGNDGQGLINATTETVSSPGDLTGISIGTAKLSKQFAQNGIDDVRYGLISVSTFLQYLSSKKVFRFLHIYTKRIAETGGLGIYTLNTDSHPDQDVNTILGQFDGVVELRETPDGDVEYRVRGFARKPTKWASL